MKIPPADIGYFVEAFSEAAQDVVDAFEDLGEEPSSENQNPILLREAMEQLIDILRRYQAEQSAPPPVTAGEEIRPAGLSRSEIGDLGDYGIHLLAQLALTAARLKMDRRSRNLEALAFPMALWTARHGGELRTLEPVVNGLSGLANRLSDTVELEQLFSQMGEIVNAVAPALRQDLENTNPRRPWRILLLNRAIVATRSQNPQLMRAAFEALIEHIPEDVPQFFREGMEQMDALNYPAHVREVMEAYYRIWSAGRTLH